MATTRFSAERSAPKGERVRVHSYSTRGEPSNDGFSMVERKRHVPKPLSSDLEFAKLTRIQKLRIRHKQLGMLLESRIVHAINNWHQRFQLDKPETHAVNIFKFAAPKSGADRNSIYFAGLHNNNIRQIPSDVDYSDITVDFDTLIMGQIKPHNWKGPEFDPYHFIRAVGHPKILDYLDRLVDDANNASSKKVTTRCSLEPHDRTRYDHKGKYVNVFPKGTQVYIDCPKEYTQHPRDAERLITFYRIDLKLRFPVQKESPARETASPTPAPESYASRVSGDAESERSETE